MSAGIVLAALGVVGKIMDKTPDYDQSKRKKYFKLKEDYENEIKKQYIERDDNLISRLDGELRLFLEAFGIEISGQKD